MPKTIRIALDIPAGPHSQNAEWLASDHAVDDLGKYRCNIALEEARVFQFTVNSGTKWISINAGDPLVANSSYGFDIYVRAGDLINFRSPTAGTTTVALGRLDSVKDEG